MKLQGAIVQVVNQHLNDVSKYFFNALGRLKWILISQNGYAKLFPLNFEWGHISVFLGAKFPDFIRKDFVILKKIFYSKVTRVSKELDSIEI